MLIELNCKFQFDEQLDKLEFMEAIQWGYLTDLKNQTQQKKY